LSKTLDLTKENKKTANQKLRTAFSKTDAAYDYTVK